MSPIIRAIQAEAQRQRVTAYRLAQLSGLRVDTTTRILAGRGSPTLATLESVAKALGLVLRIGR